MSSGLIRWSGLAAMLGSVLGAVLSPVLAHLWDPHSGTYTTYGRPYFLSLPPELLGLRLAWVARMRAGGTGKVGLPVVADRHVARGLGGLHGLLGRDSPGFLWIIIATPFLVGGFMLLAWGCGGRLSLPPGLPP